MNFIHIALKPLHSILAAVDLLTMISYLPYSVLFYIIYGDQESPQRNTYGAICYLIFHAVTILTSHTASIWLTVAVAMFRYIHLTTNRGKQICDMFRANLTILIVIIGSVLMNVPQLLVYEIRHHDDESSNSSWYFLTTDNDKYGRHEMINLAQFVSLAVFVKITPCVLLTVLSVLLIKIIISAQDRYMSMRKRQSTTSTYQTSTLASASERKRQNQTHQTTRMLIAVIVMFIVIELPQGILFVMSGLLEDFFEDVYWPMGNFLDLVTIVSCCVNFLLYCSMSAQFCEILVQMLKYVCPCLKRSNVNQSEA